jgi:hypothetical protein
MPVTSTGMTKELGSSAFSLSLKNNGPDLLDCKPGPAFASLQLKRTG